MTWFPSAGLRIAVTVPLLLSPLLLAAVGSPLQAEPRWPDERQAGPFIMHADFSLAGHDGLIEEMARLQRDLTRRLGVGPSRERVHLFLFGQGATYRDYVKLYFPDVPYRRALFIKRRGPGMVFIQLGDEFATDVRHEGTHALLHGALPMVPLWLDEGLAEYFEVPPDQRVYGNPHLGRTRWLVRLGQIPRLERLEEINSLDGLGHAEYRNAWAWVHFMLHGPPAARRELRGFLRNLEAHSPPGTLSRRLRSQIPDLDREFAAHFKRWRE